MVTKVRYIISKKLIILQICNIIIKDQGVATCRDKFYKEYIRDSLASFTDGFIVLGNLSTPGVRYRSVSSKYLLKGFVLFSVDGFETIINGKILYGRKGYGIGKILLLEAVYDFATVKGIT